MYEHIKRIVVHCSATPDNRDIGAAEIRRMHQDRGFSDIGYHYVIRRDGRVELGRDLDKDDDVLDEVGAHAKGYNTGSWAVCLVGGTDANDRNRAEANFTFEQYVALYNHVLSLKEKAPLAEVLGHRDLPGVTKACPCFDVKSFFGNRA